MTLLQSFVPVATLVFLLYRLRNSPLVVCALPITLSLGETIFITTWGVKFNLPLVPIPLDWRDIVLGTLIAAWLYARLQRPLSGRLTRGMDLAVVGLMMVLVVVQIPISWLRDDAFKPGVVLAVRFWTYLPLSIWLWAGILRRSTRAEIENLLQALALVTIPLAGLYALSAVGVSIYPQTSWDPISFGAATIVRDYITFPVWLKVALAYFLLRPRQNLGSMVAIGVLLVAVILTYTRSWVLPAAMMIGIAFVHSLLAAAQVGAWLRRGVVTLLAALVAIGAVMTVAPDNVNFLVGRMEEAQTMGLLTTNLVSRANTVDEITWYISGIDPIWGAGFAVQTARDSELINQNFLVGDILWAYVLLPLGWSGVAVFGLLFVIFVRVALRLWGQRQNLARSQLSALAVMVLVWDIVRTFTSAEYVLQYPVAAALVFGLVIVEARAAWRPPVSPVEAAGGKWPLSKLANSTVQRS